MKKVYEHPITVALVFVLLFISYLNTGYTYKKWEKKQILVSDALIYYEYLPAIFIFNDITWQFSKNRPEDFDGEVWLVTDEEGRRFPKTSIGVALLEMPFFLVALAVNQCYDLGSYGYSPLFEYWIMLGAVFYVLAGLFVLRKILIRFVSHAAALITIISFGLATGLMFYGPVSSGHSHAYSFFLVTSFIYLVMRWHDLPTFRNSILLGVTLGLITLVRPVNALIVIFAILYSLQNKGALQCKLNTIKKSFPKVSIAVVSSLAIVSIQLIFWKLSVGSWFVNSYGDERFFWDNPKFLEGFFGFRKGLFVYSPVLILAIFGLLIKSKKMTNSKMALLVYFGINAYVVLSWWCWWYGGSYTHRAFLDSLAVLAIFFALFVDYLIKGRMLIQKLMVASFIGFCVYLNDFQIKQHMDSFLHYDSMTWESYKRAFLQTKFENSYWETIEKPDYAGARKGKR